MNERDELGSDLVPDYMTVVEDGAFYGWPYSYFGQHLDPRVKPQRPDMVANAQVPDYALGPHTASLGLAASPRGRRAARTWMHCQSVSVTGCSWASTAHGTASPAAATG